MDLTKKKCVPCEGGIPKFTEQEEDTHLKELDGWRIERENVHRLKKEFTFRNFNAALEFVNRVGELAEEEGHHPNINFTWGKVDIEIWTHVVSGLTENDFILAAKIDELIESSV